MAGYRKRSNGEGTIFHEEARNRWVALLTLPDGSRRKRTAMTKREASQLLRQMATDVQNTGGVFDERSRFQDLSGLWREKVLESKAMAPATRTAKTWALDRLEEELGRVRLVDLKADRIEDALENMLASGLGRESLIKVKSVLNQVCRFGERRDLLRKNPVGVVELPAGMPKALEGRALTEDQARCLLAASGSHRLDALWKVLLMLGLRHGEATAIHWEDIDFDNQVLRVRRTLHKVDGAFQISDQMKTKKSRRNLDMPMPLIEALSAHRDRQQSERDSAGARWSGLWSDLAFTTTTGTPLDPSNVRRDLSALAGAAGLGHWTPTELRHSCVSILSAAGVPLENISDVMGHDGTRMTWGVYRHVLTPSIGAAAGPMSKVFG